MPTDRNSQNRSGPADSTSRSGEALKRLHGDRPVDRAPPVPERPIGQLAEAVLRQARRDFDGERQRKQANMEHRKTVETSQAIKYLAETLGRRYAPNLASLEAFVVTNERQQQVLDRLRAACVEHMVPRGDGLVFLGSVGTGKDHLLAAMLYAACRAGFRCRWMNAQEFYGDIRDRIDSGASEDARFKALSLPDVLAISDPCPPAGGPTAWNLTQLYRLLDRRYRNMRSTWVTINARDEAEADEKLSAPVWDRLRENALILKCFWPSYREKGGVR